MKKNESTKLSIREKLLKFYKGEVRQFNAIFGVNASAKKSCCL